ncbi:MAG TPA: transglycosylase domain-containing protein [Candidatus Saccharimonadales bacterium]|nr:transglycosylase domain-containing protein [Candidatus Saccharimonadales bacterium]
MKKNPRRSGSRPITTRSGKVLKVNRSLGERYSAMRQAKALRKVNRLRGLPKSRVKRIFWRMHPKRLAAFWFSRDGAIMALKIAGIAILAMFILTLAVFAYYRKDLKDITDLSGSNIGGSVSYYDQTGKVLLWQDYNAVKRVPVPSSDISQYMKDATVAVEDKDFYNHRGFDIRGILRAAYVDILHRGGTQGGSTITQQLVKLTQDYNQDRTLALKVKELILAVELERNYTKDQILTSYLDIAPYGGVDYGVQAAAQDYFHVDAKNLTLAQAAFLATIPKSPTYYSKYSSYFDEQLFTNRYDYVLDQMASQGKITKQQASAAKKVDVLAQVHPMQSYYAGIRAPYFVLAARDELNRRFASQSAKVGGWKVITTLDMNLQNEAEKAVQENLNNVKYHGGDEEAMVVEDTATGQMRALVGGVDFFNKDHGQFNYAHTAYISPGSSFKPYDYTTLIENNTNVGAGSVLYDSQGPIPGYPCTIKSGKNINCLHDYDFRYPGPETLRYALGGSRNVPAVKAMLQATPNDTSPNRTQSINKVISTADSLMGYDDAYKCFKDGVDVNQAKKSDETQCYGASAIGDGAYLHLDQHINGVASLARLGKSIPNTYIKQLVNATGKTFYTFKQPKGTQVVRPDSAYIMDQMASDPNASYFSSFQKWQHYKGWQTAVKTGTTNDNYDGLMMSWNTQYAVGSWVGYHTRTKALTTAMENLTMPLTRRVMEFALDSLNKQPVNWQEPPGIQHLPAYVIRNHVGYGSREPSPSTDLYPSWYKQKAVSSKSVVIDKVSGKVATSCTPAAAKQTLGGSAAPNAFSIDVFYPPGQNASNSSNLSSNGPQDDVHHCGDASPTVTIVTPTTGDTCDTSCTITATPFAGTHPLNDSNYPQYPGTVTISVNGKQVCTSSHISDGQPVSCTYSPTFSGGGTVTATVTDSVLYQGSDTQDGVNFTKGASPLTFTNINTSGASWTGGSGTYTIKDTDHNTTLCGPTSSQSCPYSASHGTHIELSDSNGDPPKSDQVP